MFIFDTRDQGLTTPEHLCKFDGEALHVPLADDFKLHHGPYEAGAKEEHLYVGRDQLIESLASTLHDSENFKGSYLVAGYRGVGKTSLVNRALERYQIERSERGLRRKWIFGSIVSRIYSLFRLWNAKSTLYVGIRQLEQPELKLDQIRGLRRWISRTKTASWFLDVCRKRLESISGATIVVRLNLGHDATLSPRATLIATSDALIRELASSKNSFSKMWAFVYVLSAAMIFFVIVDTNIARLLYQYYEKSKLVELLINLRWNVTTSNLPDELKALVDTLQNSLIDIKKSALAILHPGVPSVFLAFTSVYFLYATIHYLSKIPSALSRRALFKDVSDLCRRINTRKTDGINLNFGRFGSNRSIQSPPLDAANIESRLLRLLAKAGRRKHQIDLIFVLDELDKIGTSKDENTEEAKKIHPSSIAQQLRKRKIAVDELLNGLKNFITTANARFIFIAGREMLDSYHAERGNTNALYESTFHRVFAVNSLFTDNSDRDSIYSLVETYVCRRLMSQPTAVSLFYLRNAIVESEVEKVLADKKKFGELLLKTKDNTTSQVRSNINEDYRPYTLQHYYFWVLIAEFAHIEKLIKTSKLSGQELNTWREKRNIQAAQKAQRIILTLRHFVQFLTIHSWGNSKRLCNLFESFVGPQVYGANRVDSALERSRISQKSSLNLKFTLKDERRFQLGSELYILLHRSLSRQLGTSGDKVTVSTLATLQAIVKFHGVGFSRYHLLRMSEMLNVYRPPELHRLTDSLVSSVLRPHLRRIRKGIYGYRFMLAFEESIRFISQTDDMESAAFTFSLDSMENVKAHYEYELDDLLRTLSMNSIDRPEGNRQVIGLHIVLGDYYLLEQDYDTAAVHYQSALGGWSVGKSNVEVMDLEYFVRRIEAWLKLGNAEEKRFRYERAASCYRTAEREVGCRLLNVPMDDLGRDNSVNQDLSGDNKFELLQQPTWARLFLNLKTGSRVEASFNSASEEILFNSDKAFQYYRQAQLHFYAGNYQQTINELKNAIKVCGNNDDEDCYTSAYICSMWAHAELIGFLDVDLETAQIDKFKIRNQTVAFLQAINFFDTHVDSNADNRIYKDRGPVNFEEFEEIVGNISYSVCSGSDDADCFESAPVGQKLFAAGMILERAGLYLHASIAFSDMVAIWSNLIDSIIFSELRNIVKLINIPENYSLDKFFEKQMILIDEVANAARRNAELVEGRASELSLKSWRMKDLSYAVRKKYLTKERSELVPDDYSAISGPGEFVNVWCRTGTLPRVISIARLSRFVGLSIRSALGGCEAERRRSYANWCLGRPYSHKVRFVAVNEWLDGRWLLSCQEAFKNEDRFYVLFESIVSLYQASQQVRIASVSGQSQMFPPNAFIYYNMWSVLRNAAQRTLASGVDFDSLDSLVYAVKEKFLAMRDRRLRESTEMHSSSDSSTTCKDMCNVLSNILGVGDGNLGELLNNSSVRDHHRAEFIGADRYSFLPDSICDLEYVSSRAIRHLTAASRMGVRSSRSGSEVLRNKYYLNDDYQSPEAHMDWVTIQMIRPTALILIDKVKNEMASIQSHFRESNSYKNNEVANRVTEQNILETTD